MKAAGVLIFGFLILASLPAHGQDVLVDPDPKGYASGIYGQVLVLEPESEAPKVLSDSDPVFEGSRLTASENSFAEIDLLDGSVLKVDEMTQVDLAKVSADPVALERTIDLSMLYGTLRISTQDGYSEKSVFKVTTPVAVAGVRGTDFAVEYESEDESTVDVFEGEVGVGQDGQVESVGEGESSKAVRGRGFAKSKLEEHRQERWDQHRQAMDVHGRDRAEARLREKIDQVRAANPADPRLGGLENALQNVSKDRSAARERFDAAREQMKDRRAERIERMREFAKKHGREKFEKSRRFRGGALTPEERQKASEKMRERRKAAREKASERHQERREKRDQRKDNIKDRRDDRKDTMKERRGEQKENMKERRNQRQDQRQERKGKARERRR